MYWLHDACFATNTFDTHPVWVLSRLGVRLPLELDLSSLGLRPLAQVLDRERARGHVTRGRPRGHFPRHSLDHYLKKKRWLNEITLRNKSTWYVLPGTRFSVNLATRGAPRSTIRGFLRRMSMATWYLGISADVNGILCRDCDQFIINKPRS